MEARIVDGAYPPGHRLVLAQTAHDLGVSVVPVREAIRRLEAEGLVTFQRNVGGTVAGIGPIEYLYTMQTLALVEGATTALSAPLTGPDDLARAVNEEMRACLQHVDPLRSTRLDQDFHAILFEHCPIPTSWTSCTAAGHGRPPCGPRPSGSSPSKHGNRSRNTATCSD